MKGPYDLVTAFECIHDMSDPVAALATMRRLAEPNSSVVVMDERTNERFTTAENPGRAVFVRLQYLGVPAGRSSRCDP